MYNISRKSLPLHANTLSTFPPEHLVNPRRTALNINTPTCPTATLLLLRHARVIESSHLNFASALIQMFIQLLRVRVFARRSPLLLEAHRHSPYHTLPNICIRTHESPEVVGQRLPV